MLELFAFGFDSDLLKIMFFMDFHLFESLLENSETYIFPRFKEAFIKNVFIAIKALLLPIIFSLFLVSLCSVLAALAGFVRRFLSKNLE